MPVAAQGGNIRVGLEDSLRAGPGVPAVSNARHVGLASDLLRSLGLEPATPDETHEILAPKGADKVGF
jgi:uncharacterized protein (DUF849 family)